MFTKLFMENVMGYFAHVQAMSTRPLLGGGGAEWGWGVGPRLAFSLVPRPHVPPGEKWSGG